MEPIEPGSPPTQGPETGAAPESQWPGLWDDLASVRELAERAQGVPNLRHLSLALVALCQVVENLAQRVEALESPKPCEGCEETAQAVSELVQGLEQLVPDAPEREGVIRRLVGRLRTFDLLRGKF